MSEKVSALLDGELSGQERDEVLRQISRDTELAAAWSRYHLIGAVIREESINHNSRLLDKIVSSLHAEPSVDQDNENDPASGKVIALPPLRERRKRTVLAIAASLVAVTTLAVFMTSNTPTYLSTPLVVDLESQTKWEKDLEHEDALNGFLVEHGEFTPASGMNGLASYAKFVSYDSSPE